MAPSQPQWEYAGAGEGWDVLTVAMADKRKFPRVKRRLVIEFHLAGSPYYGFTHNLSPMGLFVRSIRIPTLGTSVSAELHLPDGKRIPLQGRVVRSFRAPTALARLVPSGFGMALSSSSEEYFQFLAAL
ncbi:MAG TPA: PilZ domain-containing protein [Thermoanaerobaculia bacterium]|nr:PilZ domain-containing protein [Thermoanaerobaculia bacterium]